LKVLIEATLTAAVVGTIVLIVASRSSERRSLDSRRRIAEACGLEDMRFDRGVVRGRHGSLTVQIDIDRERGGANAVVTLRGLVPVLQIERTTFGARVREAIGGGDLEIGDPGFDAEVVIGSSDPAIACALLDGATRRCIRDVLGAGYPFSVRGGTLTASLLKHVGRRDPFTVETVGTLLDVAHRLEAPQSLEARLADVARNDPLGSVRSKALQVLLDTAAAHPETQKALRAAVRDASAEIRLLAARALCAEGEPVLRDLVVDPLQPDAVVEAAVIALGPRLTLATARGMLVRADSGRVRSGTAALRVVAQGGAPEVPFVVDLLMRVRGGLAIAAIEALATIGGPAVEAPLVQALGAGEPAVAAAAARALARWGTVAAVPALRTAEARGVEVGPPARTAIAAIQSRVTGATPGQVSLAGASGEVSVVDSIDGQVSLEKDEPAR
jgi:hypothetical protein